MKSNDSNQSSSVTSPGQGKILHAFGEEVCFLLTGAETGGKLTMWQEIVPPGGGPPPHLHRNEDEWFVVQQGRFEFLFDGKWCEMPVDSVIYIPKEAVHTFRNVGEETGRLLVSTSPSGFEDFFARCAEVFASEGGPDMARIVKIAAENGIEFV